MDTSELIIGAFSLFTGGFTLGFIAGRLKTVQTETFERYCPEMKKLKYGVSFTEVNMKNGKPVSVFCDHVDNRQCDISNKKCRYLR